MPSPFLHRARHTLGQAVSRYSTALQGNPEQGATLAAVKSGLGQLQSLTAKLESRCLRVAVFGLVSRGKSAVINALVGENILETGPLHGVTRWPRSVYWQPEVQPEVENGLSWQIELIDTPGLDEVGGDVRAEMAQTVATQADLILFVVSGDITQLEYEALLELQRGQKPLLLVFNKGDLYPDVDRQAVYETLQTLRADLGQGSPSNPLAVDDVVTVAASPAPLKVRVEWPDGRTSEEWEPQPPQIEPLRQALLAIVAEDGAALVALNALRNARAIEGEMVGHVSRLHGDRADETIWRFAKYKAAAVALNPIAGLDLLGGVVIDLVMIRTLARLYGFPITSHEAGRLWRAILKSSGTLLLSEVGSGLLGAGKTTAALVTLVDSVTGVAALAGAMTAQASAAGYGSYTVGKAAKTYLEQGCTWGPEGVSATLAAILQDTDASKTLARLRQEVQADLNLVETST
ncbi:GTP-binding protein [Nodosilinea sp. LEGE 06152]|uniref:GTP-binding protein n=1 Tax=Nodosilinea sp. LEGE 06152 TaxID=2777966 RepID=UPI0018810374|nr:GTP-binding protein [Nodosilinea sp. LEGE 06152]MBE9158298.1 GTP-binding protein [Nodosilinea sp. LEGE 06152]